MHAPNIVNPLTRKYMSVPTIRSLNSILRRRSSVGEAGSKKLLFCYFQITNFPLAVMTDLIRSGMDNIKFVRVFGLILVQAAWSAFSNEAKFCGVYSSHLSSYSRIDQRFSIGFRSGELAGQTPFPMTVMLWF